MNILLTGEVQVGKSTIIHKILQKHPDWNVGGFVTVKAPKEEELPPHWPENREFSPDGVYICRAGKPLFSSDFGMIGDCSELGFPKGFPRVFDDLGSRLLNDVDGRDLILMDELGFMENEAEVFQENVLRTLKGGVPVLGVVKKKSSPFLDRVRALSQVRVIEVTEENREILLPEVEKAAADAVTLFQSRGKPHNSGV